MGNELFSLLRGGEGWVGVVLLFTLPTYLGRYPFGFPAMFWSFGLAGFRWFPSACV